MVSRRQLLQIVEAALLAGPKLPPLQRVEVSHILHNALPDFQDFLQYPDPNAGDRAQVLRKEVRLPNVASTPLDDQDVQIALKLSDDLHLNELECVRLLISAHQEWNLLGRDPIEILRLASGLWFTERRALITTLQLLLRAVVLDEDLDPDLVADIQHYVEGLFKSGLRQTLITLIKDLNREEPAGFGGSGVEQYVLDSRGALVKRESVSLRECLSLCQCLVFSCLIVRMGAQEMKELYSLLKDCCRGLDGSQETTKPQISHTILFVIVISLMSDALSGSQELPPVLSTDSLFRKEFHEQIMAESVGDEGIEGYVSIACLAWAVFLMLTSSSVITGLTLHSPAPSESSNISLALARSSEQNAFRFLVQRILRTPAFQNDDEDMVFMYRAYLHKMLTSFLSEPLGRDKVKEMRDSAMISLEVFYYESTSSSMTDDGQAQQQMVPAQAQPYISLLELITEVYQHEADLTLDNDVLWNFARFASEDHTSHVTLVAFLTMLTALASTEEGARKVYLLLQSKTSRSVGWQTLFNTLNVYEQHFNQSIQTTGVLPPFQEGDAKALEAYLKVVKKVMENGNKLERAQWFPDIEPLFKLLSFENVPPYLKGALRNAIATFVGVSPVMKDKIWALLEQYDLPMVAGSAISDFSMQEHSAQIYDMAYELNEVEARREEYPSTLSYVRLINELISYETEATDKGLRFLGIFRFIRDHIFSSFSQRAYSDQVEKWQLVVACLKHFQMMLCLFNPSEEDMRSHSSLNLEQQLPVTSRGPLLAGQAVELPTIDIMKDFMSGKTIFRNLMSILMLGVNTILEERFNQSHGIYLEEAVHICFEVLLLALNKDMTYADTWRPLYQPVDVVLGHHNHQLVALLEYVRYDALPAIQRCSIQIMMVLSARVPQLVSIILEANTGDNLIEDYAACLEARSHEVQAPDSTKEDGGFLILQLLISNLSRPAPNITHLLLKFDVSLPIEKTVLQPKRHYSCLRVLLNVLDVLNKPDVNAILYEFGFQLLHELCIDSLTSAATIELLQTEKYNFFSKYLKTVACEPLPKRKTNQMLRTSSLHQRAWLLKLLALDLHVSDMDIITQRESCEQLLSHLFTEAAGVVDTSNKALVVFEDSSQIHGPNRGLYRIKVLELLDIVQFQPPETQMELPWELQTAKDDLTVSEILGKAGSVEEGGVYYYSERGDRLIDLTVFRDKLWQEYKRLELQYTVPAGEQRLALLRGAVQQLLRWAWKFNRNVEEQAAQLHMLLGWSHLVEVAISRRFNLLHYRLQILLEIIHSSLTATTSPDCSLKMALPLSQVSHQVIYLFFRPVSKEVLLTRGFLQYSAIGFKYSGMFSLYSFSSFFMIFMILPIWGVFLQVVMTCMAKLQELSFICPASDNTDDITYIDLLSPARLSNSACQSIFMKLIASILREDSSETLRRRQYTTMISYLQYCRGTIDPDIPLPVMRSLLFEGQDGDDDRELEQIDKEQGELVQLNSSILKSEATSLVNVLAKDITQGSEMGKAMAFYALDALLVVDTDQIILSQIQSRGLLQNCLADISTNSYQVVLLPSAASVRRLYTLEAELALLLRIGYQNKKRGAQALFAMGALQHLTSCKAIDAQISEGVRSEQVTLYGTGLPSQHERHHLIVLPVLRLVSCLATLVESNNTLEEGSEVGSEFVEFVKTHQVVFARVLRDDKFGMELYDLEELDLVTAITSKVWHLVKADDLGITQALYSLMCVYFLLDGDSRNRYVSYIRETKRLPGPISGVQETARKVELLLAHIRCNLISFLFTMLVQHGLRLHFSNPTVVSEMLPMGHLTLGSHKQPTLLLVASLLEQAVIDLSTIVEERALLLTKIQDINELSRHEVDEIIKAYSRLEHAGDAESLRKRRYIALIEMCSAAGNRESLIALYYYIIEHALNILFIHYEKTLQIPEQLRGAVEHIEAVDSLFGSNEELQRLNEKLLPTLQHLERTNEERARQEDKQIGRLIRSLKQHIILDLHQN